MSVGKIRCLYLGIDESCKPMPIAVSSNRKIYEQTQEIRRSKIHSTKQGDNLQNWNLVLGYCLVFAYFWPRHPEVSERAVLNKEGRVCVLVIAQLAVLSPLVTLPCIWMVVISFLLTQNERKRLIYC